MTAITIDTYALISSLKDAGVPEQQAKATVDAIAKFVDTAQSQTDKSLEQIKHDYKLDDIATKRDLKELELTLQLKIAESKSELTRWVIGAGFLQVALIGGLILKLADKI